MAAFDATDYVGVWLINTTCNGSASYDGDWWDWLNENIELGMWHYSYGAVWFKDPADAITFKLRYAK
jgi:hypothetical protein